MANFVRDGLALEIPDAQLSLLKTCFDSADNKLEKAENKLKDFQDKLETVELDGKKYLADSAVVEALKQAKTDAQAKAQVEALQAQVEVLNAELGKLRLDASDETVLAKVAARRALERSVSPFLNLDDADLAAKSDRQLKEELIKTRYNYSLDELAAKSSEAIDAMLEVALRESNLDASARKQDKNLFNNLSEQKDSLNSAYGDYVSTINDEWKSVLKN